MNIKNWYNNQKFKFANKELIVNAVRDVHTQYLVEIPSLKMSVSMAKPRVIERNNRYVKLDNRVHEHIHLCNLALRQYPNLKTSPWMVALSKLSIMDIQEFRLVGIFETHFDAVFGEFRPAGKYPELTEEQWKWVFDAIEPIVKSKDEMVIHQRFIRFDVGFTLTQKNTEQLLDIVVKYLHSINEPLTTVQVHGSKPIEYRSTDMSLALLLNV